ncbi:GNAT family N-acetyltransferase [Bradyrhizobium sediminis]|uniref:GNAT family N-acetyltransferase n=2 Tax=Bradyrhizobium sediminis TaxID=2840469 RepID=A0A975NJK9_9BRAD|nr:GNAT family N-acetyltransferase [Bradyrhizobium sediminis]QWG15289.1 GNAT family N-acetyltransferase [Bradyrhizobium sediminis]
MISVTIDSPNPDIGPQWDDLVPRANSNVFMNPAALTAAAELNFARIQVLLAWEEGGGERKLVGVWALQSRRPVPFWPMLLEALPYNYAFLSSPVVDPVCVDEVIAAFFAAIEKSPSLPKVLSLQSLDAECPSYPAISRELARRGIEPLMLSEDARPFVTREFGVKRSGSTRKKLRQEWKRLSALGTVDVVNDRTLDGARQAFESFLVLEKASWKGDRGTALLSDPRDAAFVRRLFQDLAAQGNASVALLRVNGEPISAQVLMYCGATAYTWKTAFDAHYGKYSPGALLIDKITDELFAGPDITAINSCAIEASFMGQLWAGRRVVVDMLLDIGPGKSLGYRMEAGRQLGYQHLRSLRDRLRRWLSPGTPKKPAMAAPH